MNIKTKQKRILAYLLALVMVVASLVGNGFTSSINMNVVHAADDEFYIEDGVLVAYFGADEYITIPDTVTEIGEEVFLENYDITSVTIPASVEKIGDRAFLGSLVEEVIFEGAMPEFGEEPFDCWMTVSFVVQTEEDADILRDVLSDLTEGYDYEITVVGGNEETDPEPEVPTLTIADDWTYEVVTIDGTEGYKVTGFTGNYTGSMNALNQKEVEIPAEYEGKPVLAIGKTQDIFGTLRNFPIFEVPAGVKAITIPDSVKVIEPEAFDGCQNLTAIDLANVETIGAAAFRNCGLTGEIEIPATLDLAWDGEEFSFAMCAGITAFKVADGHDTLSSNDGVLFNADGTVLIAYPLAKAGTEYAIPEGTTTVNAYAFKQNQSNKVCELMKVTFPETLTEVGEQAFQASGIEDLTISAGVAFDGHAFALNENLTTVTFAEGVTTIPESLLHGCENLVEVNLPSTLKTIEKGAFVRAKNLTEIELPEGLEVIGDSAFEGSSLTAITIPGSVKEIGALAFYMSKDLAEINFADGAETLNIGKYAFNTCQSLTKVTIPARVKVLEDGVFSMCLALTEIDMPEVTTLKNYVFSNTGFTSFDFSKVAPKVTVIGNGTFRYAPLKSAVLPENLASLGTCTFEECEDLESVVIPESVKITTVPTDTFWYCEKLHEINLPASIKSTEPCAFSGCGIDGDKALTINIANEEKNFKRSLFDCMPIKVGDDWDQYGTWNDTYTEFTFFEGMEEQFLGQDHTEEQTNAGFDNIDKESYNTNVTINTKATAALEATCACSSTGGGTYTASKANFNYKTTSSSGTAGSGTTTDGSGTTNNSGTTGSTTGSTTVNKSESKPANKPVATGDTTNVVVYVALFAASCAVLVSCRRKKVR